VKGANLLGEGVDAAPDVVTFGSDRPDLRIEVDGTIDTRRVVAPTSNRCLHGLRIGAQELDVEHGETVSPAAPSSARFLGAADESLGAGS